MRKVDKRNLWLACKGNSPLSDERLALVHNCTVQTVRKYRKAAKDA